MGYEQAWLAYRREENYHEADGIAAICVTGEDRMIQNGAKELQTAIEVIAGKRPEIVAKKADEATDAVSLAGADDAGYSAGADDAAHSAASGAHVTKILLVLNGSEGQDNNVEMNGETGNVSGQTTGAECSEGTAKKEGAYHIFEKGGVITITSASASGVLYGCFALIRLMQTQQRLTGIDIFKEPVMPLRMLNHWDNMDGGIERGYSGRSFFFKDNQITVDDRIRTYARLLASVGINAAVINNVNVFGAASWLITDRYFKELTQLSEIFAEYGIGLYLSLNYASPIELGGLTTSDPLDAGVIAWWKEKMKEVFTNVPNLKGFLVKADSEGRPGPFTYGRTHADGANMLAEAAAPYGGIIIWRCFVYNCRQDWRDKKTDRARAGFDNFIQLDGQFADNVILQIKNGPMDFQVREPVHPLFGALKKTNQILEVQIAQEYTGQQRDLCYLIPRFKEILDFRTYITVDGTTPGSVGAADGTASGGTGTSEAATGRTAAANTTGAVTTLDTVCDIVSGKTLSQHNCGMAAVANTGNDDNWTGHDLAAANFYGFGRLAFEPQLSSEEIAKEWIVMTYGNDKEVVETLLSLLMQSLDVYEKYTAPLGIGWMVNPNHHYGPNVDGYEYDRWGTYHRADHLGIGVDRSHAGTGYAMLYQEPNASLYDDPAKCPDELILFFHHMPYAHVLRSGKTILQHIYDTHFEGADAVEEMARQLAKLKDKLPERTFSRMTERFEMQKNNAREWRDRVNTYFFRMTGIGDEKGRTIY